MNTASSPYSLYLSVTVELLLREHVRDEVRLERGPQGVADEVAEQAAEHRAEGAPRGEPERRVGADSARAISRTSGGIGKKLDSMNARTNSAGTPYGVSAQPSTHS
jgi:hypothetical protein